MKRQKFFWRDDSRHWKEARDYLGERCARQKEEPAPSPPTPAVGVCCPVTSQKPARPSLCRARSWGRSQREAGLRDGQVTSFFRMKLGLYSECESRALRGRMEPAFLCFKRIMQAAAWLRTVVGQERPPGDQASDCCNWWVSLELCYRWEKVNPWFSDICRWKSWLNVLMVWIWGLSERKDSTRVGLREGMKGGPFPEVRLRNSGLGCRKRRLHSWKY